MGRGPPVQDESRLSEQRSRCKAAKVGTPEAYAVVRRRAARPSQRRRWAFFISLLVRRGVTDRREDRMTTLPGDVDPVEQLGHGRIVRNQERLLVIEREREVTVPNLESDAER